MATAKEVYADHPTPAEIDDVLGQRLSLALATHDPAGGIHLAFVIFLHAEGRLYLETASVTRKARNIARDPRVSVLVQGTASSGRHLMASADGAARLLVGEEAAAANHRLRAKYVKPAALPGINRAWDRFDDVGIEVTPRRWRSWTGGVFRAESERDLDMPYDDVWIED